MTGVLLSATPLMAVLIWLVALLIDPGPYDPGATFLIGLGMLATTSVGTAGLVLVGGRWARRSIYGVLIATFALAVARPIDGWWISGAILTSVAVVTLSTGPVSAGVRKLPAATGPPQRSVLLTMGLIASPLALGLSSLTGSTVGSVIVGVSGLIVAFWYSRVVAGGLYFARYGWPLLAIALAPTQPTAAAIACVVLAVAVAWIGADPSVKVAFHPPTEKATVYPIPPELAPKEVLDAAHLDEKGHRI